MIATALYNSLANLLDYPTEDTEVQVAVCALAAQNDANLLSSIRNFRATTKSLPLTDLQELYTRTFDLNPVCALEIGYHLFGENYKRGEFLANLHETEAPFNLGQEHQLPDYLPVLLRLLTKLNDEELRQSLISECMLPALTKMLKAFGEVENPYRHLIEMTNAALRFETGLSSVKTADLPRVKRASLPVLPSDGWSPMKSVPDLY